MSDSLSLQSHHPAPRSNAETALLPAQRGIGAAMQFAEWEAEQARLEHRRWSFSAALMLFGVVALIAALHWRPSRPMRLPPQAMPIIVNLSPAPQAAAPPNAQPPGPRQQQAPKPQPRKAPPTPKIDSPTPSEIALPTQESAPETVQSDDQPPAPQTSSPDGESAPPGAQTAAPVQSARSFASTESRPSYEQLLLGQLQGFKRYPHVSQMRRQQGVPYVRFRMDRSGRVLAASLERSSGYAALDAEAVALPSRASPLPPPPDEVPGDPLDIVVPIEFFLKR